MHPANRSLQPSQALYDLLRHYEQAPKGGYASSVYICPTGHPTIGWGHVVQRHERSRFSGPITQAEADALLVEDVTIFAQAVLRYVQVPLTRGQFDALTAFAFNVGISRFKQSTLLRLLNAGDARAAAKEFDKWVYGKVSGRATRLNGLVRRRADERRLFESRPHGIDPDPSAPQPNLVRRAIDGLKRIPFRRPHFGAGPSHEVGS